MRVCFLHVIHEIIDFELVAQLIFSAQFTKWTAGWSAYFTKMDNLIT